MSKEPQLGTCDGWDNPHPKGFSDDGKRRLPEGSCHNWQPLPTDRATEPEEATVEYRVAREWQNGGVGYGVMTFRTLDEAKSALRQNAELFGVDLKAGWIETRTVTPWTKM